MSDINDKVNFLFKKFIGVPNTFNDSEYKYVCFNSEGLQVMIQTI